MTARFIVGDVFDGLATLEDGTVDLVVTSPPFLALRSYCHSAASPCSRSPSKARPL